MPDSSFSTEKGLAGLKDFQRKTVDYVFERLYGRDPTFRFLVADEVGLGKTLVARGIIVKTLEHLWKDVDRIDVVYVCSNAAIARQNINKLKIGDSHAFSVATRLTYLPEEIRSIRENKVNFISLTPGTAFDHAKSRGGHVRERAILYRMLFYLPFERKLRTGLLNLLQAKAGKDSWRYRVNELSAERLDPDISLSFRESVLADEELYEKLENCCERFSRYRDWKNIPLDDSELRYDVIARLRSMLASKCMDALEPDLVILDEFQRFKHLLEDRGEASDLARALFEYSDDKVVDHKVRVLLLSATPYKMFTLDLEKEEEDHYGDFITTLKFLFNDSARVEEVENLIAEHRRAIYSCGRGDSLVEHKKKLEQVLRSVMCRTERVDTTRDKDSMLKEIKSPAPLKSSDLGDAAIVDEIATCLDAGEHIEYWKSAPYLVNFLKNYKIRNKLDNRMDNPSQELLHAFSKARSRLLTKKKLDGSRVLDPANPRMRVLLQETVEKGMWQLLWMPPSMPYSKPAGVFSGKENLTKALVFSSWNAVPNAIAAICSYEAERKMLSRASASHADLYERIRPLLRFSTSGRLTGMPVIAWMLPSPVLATEVDPLMISLRGGEPLSVSVLIERARAICRELLEEMNDRLGETCVSQTDSRVDRRWYWAAPVLIGPQNDLVDWCRNESGWKTATPDHESGTRFREHVDFLVRVAEGREKLGRQPEDLAVVLSELALAGPGVCALRALLRVGNGMDASDHDLLSAAARVASGFRSLFNMPETVAMLRGRRESSYWRSTLRYGIDGNLQSVLDEYVHVLDESLGLKNHRASERVTEIAGNIQSVLSLRTAQIRIDEIKRYRSRLSVKGFNTRCRFALRFGDIKDDNDKTLVRSSSVRDAFNSPFKPFVLASTSIGQEGLDFHSWCHAVVHWNLPSNPVDLEQREGRVHRYKGHAIRKNIAEKYGLGALRDFDGRGDPWQELFQKASAEKPAGQNDLVPYWVFEEGSARVERRIPLLPYSREVEKLKALKHSLVLYRAVFGQPRQEDLINILKKNESSSDGINELLLSLSPRGKTIVIATRNRGKLKEFRAILADAYDEILSLSDFDDFPEIQETGSSFEENALIKAKAACDLLGVDAIADDSGLVADVLHGAPGIYSARYAGEGASDEENNKKLLSELEGKENRDARFVCCIALVLKDGTQKFFGGECEGRIVSEKRGTSGFGYDPVFYVPQYGKTMAELGPQIKNEISHRAKACRELISSFS